MSPARLPRRANRARCTVLALAAFATLSALTAITVPGPALAGLPGAVGDLFVSSDVDDMTRQYDGGTGALVGPMFVSAAAAGQMAIHYGEDNNRVLIGHSAGGVEEFDATTGAYIKTYNAGGGWQWAGLYAPSGNVYIGDHSTMDVREYDSVTGAFIGVFVAGVEGPADMLIGPNGNLFICAWGGGYVREVDANTGAFVDQWSQAFGDRTNDLAFLPSGDILVTVMGSNLCYRYDSSKTLLGSFAGTGWGRTHGIDISPWDGNVYIADGISGQVHVFDPVTFVELDPAYLTPGSGAKITDPVFRPPGSPVSIDTATWGSIKERYR